MFTLGSLYRFVFFSPVFSSREILPSKRRALGSRPRPVAAAAAGTAAATTNQNVVEAFKCNRREANSLLLLLGLCSAPCDVPNRPHPSPSAYQTRGCGKSRQLSDERTLSEQHQRFVFVRLSSSLLASWCSPSPGSGQTQPSSDIRVSSYPVYYYVLSGRKPKPVWPINTSITTQLLTLPPDTDYLGGPVRSGPVFRLWLLVKFRFI